MLIYILPAIGFLAGLLIISLGGGGGAVYVGVLTGLCGVAPDIAASTSLATAIPTTLMGSFSHYRAGNVHVRIAFYLMAGAVIGTIAGSLCSGLLPLWLYTKLTGTILIILALQMGLSCIYPPTRIRKESSALTGRDQAKALAYGMLGGGMSGLIGLSGGGPITAGLFALGCTPLAAVGTSVFVIFFMSVIGFGMHMGIGHIDWHLVRLLLSGTVAGAFAGPFLLSRMDKEKVNRWMRPLIALINLSLGITVLLR